MTADGAGTVEIRGALTALRRATGLPVAFGGLVEPGRGQVRISELSGTSTLALSALAVSSGTGLGGRAIALARPCAVTDYSASRRISHEYDAAVTAEGLRSVLAVPVVVHHRVHGVLYAALRTAQPLGDRTLAAAVEAARDLSRSLAVRDGARGLISAARPQPVRGRGPLEGDGASWDRVREARAALRTLAPRIEDPELRAELLDACAKLTVPRAAGALPSAGTGSALAASALPTSALPASALPASGLLAPREVDVLVCVAAGATNAATAQRLGLGTETVKGYLRSAMRRLGAHTRGEAVAAARGAGLLP